MSDTFDDRAMFDQMTEGLEEEFDLHLPDYGQLTDFQLIDQRSDLLRELMSSGTMLEPKTEEDMEKQSVYIGLTAEMHRRNLL